MRTLILFSCLLKAADPVAIPISDNIDDMANMVVNLYFNGNGNRLADPLKPYVHEKLEARKRQSMFDSITNLTQRHASFDEIDDEMREFMENVISDAVVSALSDKDKYEKRSSERVPKVKVAVIVTLGTIISAAITAAIAFTSACTQ